MSPGLSASIADVAAMSNSAFSKDDGEEEDNKEEGDEEEDEEIEEISNSNIESEDAEDEGPTTEDEDPAARDEGLATRDEGRGMGVESLNLGGDEAVLEGQQRATSVVETAVGEPLGLGYGVLRRQEIAFGEGPDAQCIRASLATAEAEGFLTELEAQVEMHGGLIHDHTVRLGELSAALFERYDRDIRELFTRSRVVKDEIFSQRYQFKSLEHEQERVASENRELRLQIAEERHAQLDLAEIIDSMRRGQEPRRDVLDVFGWIRSVLESIVSRAWLCYD
ncbi:hypothetical protein Tco_1056535 [Tanacetum coccineum]|uniref:Uncharacterized protein n=1 Tax=Tanacetum coccineum TaxID=301880 RepID=A0ABQ5H524_9ASTR